MLHRDTSTKIGEGAEFLEQNTTRTIKESKKKIQSALLDHFFVRRSYSGYCRRNFSIGAHTVSGAGERVSRWTGKGPEWSVHGSRDFRCQFLFASSLFAPGAVIAVVGGLVVKLTDDWRMHSYCAEHGLFTSK
ncbi:MAG TPA: hypothetical protein VEF34_06210 [Syntrophobacteraceae bacterium]|nr:hypothetical protein [Syntrophobacteraceae bacterium]